MALIKPKNGIIILFSIAILVGVAFVHHTDAQEITPSPDMLQVITIGALVPESGSLAFFGEHAKFAMKAAKDDFNDYLHAKHADWRLNIDIKDTESEAVKALEQAEKLYNDGNGVSFISGPARSDSVEKIKDFIYKDENLPKKLSLVSYSSTAPGLAQEDNIYRLVPSDTKYGPVIAKIMHDVGKRVLIPVWINDAFGNGLANSTVQEFGHLAGTTVIYTSQTNTEAPYDDNKDILSYKGCTDMNGDMPGKDNPECDNQFPAIASKLNSIVDKQLDNVDASDIFVLYVGFELQDFVKSVLKLDNSVLRDVQWVGSDADVLKPDLVSEDNREIRDFLTATNFRAGTFDFESYTERFTSLKSRLGYAFDDEPLKYVYSAYDSVWAIGLAIELAGGPTSSFDNIVNNIPNAVSNNHDGALGEVSLDLAGDLKNADYAIYGIESGSWKKIGIYRTDDGRFVMNYDIGALVPINRPDHAGEHRKYATQVAMDDFNRYLSEKDADWRLSVDIRDSKTDQDVSLEQAEELYKEGILFISGPSTSSGVKKIKTDLIEDGSVADLSLVSCCSTAPRLAQDDNIYRLAPSDDKHGKVIANLMYRDGKTVLIPVWINDAFGNGLVQKTVDVFKELGGAAIYTKQTDTEAPYDDNKDILSYKGCTDMNGDMPGKDNPECDNQFPAIASKLNSIVDKQLDSVDASDIFVLYVGFELQDFVKSVLKLDNSVLRDVQWVGSDANALSSSLVNGTKIKNFMADVNFRSCIFDGDPESPKYVSLKDKMDKRFDGETPNIYAYSSYDTVWAIGLAIELAGGPTSSFDNIVNNIPNAVSNNHDGALGKVSLDQHGDLLQANYAVYGIEPTGWERIGTYYADDSFVPNNSCQISLKYDSIDFGKADTYSLLSEEKSQTITNSGSRIIDYVSVYPDDYSGLPISRPLVEVKYGNNEHFEWLNTQKNLKSNLGSRESFDVSYRMNFEHAETRVAPGTTISQDISYQIICSDDSS